MKPSGRTLIVIASASVASCALTPYTVSDLEGDKGARFNLEIAAPPPIVYRRIVERARECLQLAGFQVHADFFPDTGSGRVSLAMPPAGPALQLLMTTSIRPDVHGKTALQVSYADPHRNGALRKEFADPVGEWAQGMPGKCLNDEYRALQQRPPQPGAIP